jgi:hypothetical protein
MRVIVLRALPTIESRYGQVRLLCRQAYEELGSADTGGAQ